jgi:hypothetical protein
MPPPGPAREVVAVRGDHGLKADPEAVAAAVRTWLSGVLSGGARRAGRPRPAAPAGRRSRAARTAAP